MGRPPLRKVAEGFTLHTIPPRDNITQEEWIYLAGFYDGEGTVTVTRQRRKGHDQYIQLRFVISHTSFELLKQMQGIFGGAIHVGSVMKDKPRQKQIYMWHVDSKVGCLPILKGMLPYLRYKKREVELAIEYWSGIDSYRSQKLGQEELDRRLRIANEIQSLPIRRSSGPVVLPQDIYDLSARQS